MAKKKTKRRRKKKVRLSDTCFGRALNLIVLIAVIIGAVSLFINRDRLFKDGDSNNGVNNEQSGTENPDGGNVSEGEGSQEEQPKLYNDGIRFDFIDAGQSDSTLITTPNGRSILIDTGIASETSNILGFLENSGVGVIDYLILTHPHSDHIGGASEILTIYDVENIIMPNAVNTGSTFEKLLDRIAIEREEGCKVYSAEIGDSYTLDDCEMKIYGPVDSSDDELNNTSIIMTVRYGDFTALFSGDAEAKAEKAALEAGADIDCELMKLGHHGSSTSSTEEFLNAASPEIGIISCGKNNSYGHPHSEVINALESRGVEYYITAEDGNITVTSNGSEYRVITEK